MPFLLVSYVPAAVPRCERTAAATALAHRDHRCHIFSSAFALNMHFHNLLVIQALFLPSYIWRRAFPAPYYFLSRCLLQRLHTYLLFCYYSPFLYLAELVCTTHAYISIAFYMRETATGLCLSAFWCCCYIHAFSPTLLLPCCC